MFGRFTRAVFVSLAVMLVVSACGGGDDDAGGGDEGGGVTTTAASSATVLPTAIPNIPGLSDECQALLNVVAATTQAFTGTAENIDETFSAAQSGVPSELRDDVDVLREAVHLFVDAMNELGMNPFEDPAAFANLTPEQIEVFEEMSGVMDNSEVDSAFDNIAEWGERECDQFAPGS